MKEKSRSPPFGPTFAFGIITIVLDRLDQRMVSRLKTLNDILLHAHLLIEKCTDSCFERFGRDVELGSTFQEDIKMYWLVNNGMRLGL